MRITEWVEVAQRRATVRLANGRTGRLVWVQTEWARPRRLRPGRAIVQLRDGVYVNVELCTLEVVG